MQNISKRDELVFSVNTAPIMGAKGRTFRFAAVPHTPAHLFLETVYRHIQYVVPEFSYGQNWVLRDRETCRVFDIGSAWAKANNYPRDNRALRDVGLAQVNVLEVLPVPEPR